MMIYMNRGFHSVSVYIYTLGAWREARLLCFANGEWK